MTFSENHYISANTRGLHRIVYSDWGPEDGAPVICVHGLTGNGHDFDELAPTLAESGHRVIAPDLPGRGRSDFLPNPLDYNYRQYTHDLITLLAYLGINEPACVDWVGISLGGLLGMKLAGMKETPIRRMIINDVGPEVPQDALDFIYQVISQTYTFDTVKDLENRMRETRGLTWGPITDEQWHYMAEHNARATDEGKITYAYDPDIAVIFEDEPTGDTDLWHAWDNITCPVLLLQGQESVVLPESIIQEMRGRGPGPSMDITVFEGCGHVPSLMAPEQIDIVKEWLVRQP